MFVETYGNKNFAVKDSKDEVLNEVRKAFNLDNFEGKVDVCVNVVCPNKCVFMDQSFYTAHRFDQTIGSSFAAK